MCVCACCGYYVIMVTLKRNEHGSTILNLELGVVTCKTSGILFWGEVECDLFCTRRMEMENLIAAVIVI